MSGRSDSNRRHSDWKSDVLPLNYARELDGLPTHTLNWSGWLESNQLLLVPKTSRLPMAYTPSEFHFCINTRNDIQ